jgi:hypothetical protein
MAEKQKYLVKTIAYDGLFNYRELFRIMDVWFREKFYDKWEKRNEQYMTPEGLCIETEFTPWKKVTDYFKIIIKIEITGTNLKEVEVEVQGKKQRMHQGKVSVKLTGYLVVDYEHKWSKAPLYFLRDIYDKYIYWRITKKYIEATIEDVESLYNHLRSYLNMAQYKA